MSNFDNNRMAKEEARKKNDMRREKLAGYFFDLSKLTFAALVLGGFTPLSGGFGSEANWPVVTVGIMLTVVFAKIASLIIKSK